MRAAPASSRPALGALWIFLWSRLALWLVAAGTVLLFDDHLNPRRGPWDTARLHELGWAHSVETYDESGRLVGGLYGVRIERLFAGESMFHRATDASKVALVYLVDWLRDVGAELLDVQWTTPHLASLGAIDISRDEYLTRLASAVAVKTS